jgi:GntR family transcriptional regulator
VIDKEGDGPAIDFRLDPRSGVPAYLQIAQQVEQALAMGRLAAGDRLPTLKEAVRSLALNPNTVLKAYRELERKGLVAGRPGQGTFVTAAAPAPVLRPPELAALRRGLGRWLDQAAGAGLDDEGVRALLADELAARADAAGAAS